ncbi:MAG TPA: carbamate kinase [Solirubrobacteraceae bacterium]|nr:carbamate kinase [Solirubrobacteraceae bacterium]
MSHEQPLIVVALGGNALLKRGEPLEAQNQLQAAHQAAQLLAPLAARARLVVTHGNGPQVGLLALQGNAYHDVAPYPLDVLGAETEGQIGYVIELELDNAVAGRETAALVTRTEVDPADPAFGDPTKFIGPVYDKAQADDLAERMGWSVRPDGDRWRRVVPSPEPRRIVQLEVIRRLVADGVIVVCVGGGGVPVARTDGGRCQGVEAVIDKDLASSLLAVDLGADMLILATDVEGAYADWGTPQQRMISRATPQEIRTFEFPKGSMGPKVEAVARFVERGGRRGAIGALEDIEALAAGDAGTQIVAR